MDEKNQEADQTMAAEYLLNLLGEIRGRARGMEMTAKNEVIFAEELQALIDCLPRNLPGQAHAALMQLLRDHIAVAQQRS